MGLLKFYLQHFVLIGSLSVHASSQQLLFWYYLSCSHRFQLSFSENASQRSIYWANHRQMELEVQRSLSLHFLPTEFWTSNDNWSPFCAVCFVLVDWISYHENRRDWYFQINKSLWAGPVISDVLTMFLDKVTASFASKPGDRLPCICLRFVIIALLRHSCPFQ